MKINNNPNIQKVMGAYKTKMAKIDKTQKPIQGKDKIEISPQAREFQVAMQAYNKLPEVREAKINEIKKAIEKGTYKPSAEEVTEKILEKINFKKL